MQGEAQHRIARRQDGPETMDHERPFTPLREGTGQIEPGPVRVGGSHGLADGTAIEGIQLGEPGILGNLHGGVAREPCDQFAPGGIPLPLAHPQQPGDALARIEGSATTERPQSAREIGQLANVYTEGICHG
jgi:hypothetical protein